MSRDFECIGIPFINEAATGARFQEFASRGTPHERADGGRMIIWMDDASGAVMIWHADGAGRITCARPAYRSGADFRGEAVGFAKDPDGCRFCDPLLATQDLPGTDARPPLVFHLGNAGLMRDRILPGSDLDLVVCGFAHGVRIWRDEREFHAPPGNAEAHSSMMGFTFDPKGPTPAQYLVTGPVLRAERKRNSATNVDFWFITLGTSFFGAGPWFVLARDEDLPWGATEGNIFQAQLWACAMAVT